MHQTLNARAASAGDARLAQDREDHNGEMAAPYLGSGSFETHLETLRERHPALFSMLHPRLRRNVDVAAYVDEMNRLSWEFEDGAAGGRGEEYNIAQQDVSNRLQGMVQLLRLFGPAPGEMPGRDVVILDALAGDGTIRRLVETWGRDVGPEVISADLSRFMIDLCVAQGFPALRQSATRSLLADNVLDGVLIAYGSHHIPRPERAAAAAEALRTLKPGGRFVLHDFESGGPVDAWFGEVVHPYSATGHPHPHFSRDEMGRLLRDAGFAACRVFEMDDPFIVTAQSEAAAHRRMMHHLHAMYGLVKLPLAAEPDFAALDAMARATLGEVGYRLLSDGRVEARLMRKALIAVGEKPA